MRVAVIGSRNLTIDNLEKYLPPETKIIVSGGADSIDICAKEYAAANKIRLIQLPPLYAMCGRFVALERNKRIVQNSDLVLAFWDGRSKGTKHVIDLCEMMNVAVRVFILQNS